MKRGKKEILKKFSKYNFFWIVPLVLFILLVIYLAFFKTTSTGDDNNFFNRSEYFRNNSFEENSSKNISVIPPTPLPPSSSPPKSPGSGGKDGDELPKTPEEPKNVSPEFVASDSDSFELNGQMITNNFFKEGVCKDLDNEKGLNDFCTGEEVTEYYIENNSCKSSTIKCSAFASYYGVNTQTGCYNGMCVVKDGGRNFTKKDQIIVDEVYWDECNSEGLLKEWFLTNEGVPGYTFINCSQTFGGSYGCLEGACKQLAWDSDGMNFYNLGNCQAKGSVYLDHCTEYGSLIEYIVDSSNPTSCKEVDTYCPTGICSYGKCIVVDYDSQYSSPYETQASCTLNSKSNVTDSCRCLNDGNICYYLTEWYVSDKECASEVVDCRVELGNSNAYCSSGRCFYPRSSR